MRTLPVQSKRHQEFLKNRPKVDLKTAIKNNILDIFRMSGLSAEDLRDVSNNLFLNQYPGKREMIPHDYALVSADGRGRDWEREPKQKDKDNHITDALTYFKTSQTPYTREIIDAMNNPGPYKEIVINKGPSIGKSETALVKNYKRMISDREREEGYYWIETYMPLTDGRKWYIAFWDMRRQEWKCEGNRIDPEIWPHDINVDEVKIEKI
ncbi:MAG: hypothetical protein H7282_05145 [Cytophagaceae bacterium]|nr:hypothetical protein [Cytophagaceae bacterium]